MRHAMFGAVAATTLLLGWTASASAQGAPPTPPKVEEKKAPPPKAPEKAPPPAGTPWMEWDTLTGDWGGQRTKLYDMGIDIGARLTDDLTRVQKGSADSYQGANRYWLDVHVDLDLGKLFKESCGGTIHASYWQTGGENGSAKAGAFNGISSIDAEFRQEFAELYYANHCLKESFDFRVGKMDPTQRFNHSEYVGDFMNLASDYPVTFYPSPRFIETAFGADLFYRGKGLYAGGGIFDGSRQEGVETGHGGARHFFGEPGDLFLVAEAGYRWTDGNRPVRAALGAWRHTGDFPSLNGRTYSGSSGWYALAEGMLWRKVRDDAKDDRGGYLVLRYGDIEESTSVSDWTGTVALVIKGPLASRKNDSVGLAWSITSVSGEDGGTFRYRTEQVLEFYYKGQITPFFSVQPGFQYVANPGGTYNDALVLGVRFVVDF